MARRNLDTEYFKKPFIRGLSAPLKLFYLYVICDCNHAGVWIPDFEVANLYTRGSLTPEEVLKEFGDRIIVLENGNWFFPEIIEKQYPNGLSGSNNAVKSARDILNKYGLLDDLGNIKKQPLVNPSSTPKEIESRGSGAHIEIEIETETEIEQGVIGGVPEISFQRVTGFHPHALEIGKAFNLQEHIHHKHLVRVNNWVRDREAEGKLDYIKSQLSSYIEQQRIAGTARCSWMTWIEGHYDFCDWGAKLSTVKQAQGNRPDRKKIDALKDVRQF